VTAAANEVGAASSSRCRITVASHETSDFVRAIIPIAVVSAGRANISGTPAEVLQRYRDAGTEIFRNWTGR
jgi:beta-lactamase superfamily II metal-dependent hydrolase